MIFLYGLSPDSIATDTAGNILPDAEAQVFTALTGGSLFGATYAFDGTMTPGAATGGVVSADARGRIAFFADEPPGTLFLDFNDDTDRWPINATEITKIIQDLVTDAVSDSTEALVARLDRAAIDAQAEGVIADGLTDCAAALQALLDVHDRVMLTPGTYVIGSTIKLNSNQTLFGTDRDSVIIQADIDMPNNLDLIMSANTTTDGIEHANYCNNITLANLTVDGRGDERDIVIPNDTHGCNIKFSTVRDSKIINVRSHDGVLHNIDVCASQYMPTPSPGSPGTPSTANRIMEGPSQRVLISDCISHDSIRDDPITTHDSEDLLIQRCHVYRTRALTSGDIHGVEVDEGCRRVAVVDCVVEDHNAGFQVKGHTNTTPSRDVHLARCRAVRCRTSFHIYAADPDTLTGGAVSWAKNVSLIDCESHDVETKPIEPTELIPYAVYVSGYRNVEIRNMIIRGGTGSFANNITCDFGSDNVTIDGLYVNGACIDPADTGTGRGLVTLASAYGTESNQFTMRNVMVESTLKIPVFRASNTATVVDLDGITAVGTTGPMLYLASVDERSQATRLVQTGYSPLITVGAGTFAGSHLRPLLRGSGVAAWRTRQASNYSTVFSATVVADTGCTITVPVGGTEDLFLVQVVFDVRHETAAPVSATEANTCKFIGILSVDGVDQSTSQAIFGVPGVQWARGMVTQTYEITGLTAGDRIFKLRARHTVTGHAFTVAANHTTIQITKVNASGWATLV